MEFTPAMQQIVADAYLLSLEGRGQVVEDWAYPDAHRLAEAGWLERRFVDGELAWFWTGAGDTALGLNGLMQSAEGREN